VVHNNEAISNFIETWGVMGSVWGINSSTARVHALLILSEDPLSLDDVASRLEISRGNASMCLKELRNWRVIKQIKEPGDRKDYYVSESDAWKMFFAIIRERKRREFDPLVETVQNTLCSLKEQGGGNKGEVQNRLKQMEELLRTLQNLTESLLAHEKKAKSILPLLVRFTKEAKNK